MKETFDLVIIIYVLLFSLKTTIILGNEAEFLLSPNFNLPLINLILALSYMYWWNHEVSVREGISITIVTPF